MTITLPEALVQQLVRRISPRERSKYVAAALIEKLSAGDRVLLQSCQAANKDPEVRAIEKEFDAITDDAAESEAGTPTRRNLVGKARSVARRRNS
jgi:hypothetical protein